VFDGKYVLTVCLPRKLTFNQTAIPLLLPQSRGYLPHRGASLSVRCFISDCLLLPSILSQVLPPRDRLWVCGSRDFAAALATDEFPWCNQNRFRLCGYEIMRHVSLFSDRLSFFLVFTLHDRQRMIPVFLLRFCPPLVHMCVVWVWVWSESVLCACM
jgi:hypothetical protein